MFDPALFLKQAKEWVENRDQASYRSAASRAYYSLFNETLEFLKANHKKDLINGIKNEATFGSGSPKNIDKILLDALDNKYIGKFNMHSVVPQVIGVDRMQRWSEGAFCCGRNGSFSGVILPVWECTT